MSNGLRSVRALRSLALFLLPAVLLAQGQVTLNQPAEPLADGAEFLFQAEITGSGAGGGCHWAVTEEGRRLEPWDGVSLVEQAGGALFRAQGGEEPRTLQIRATAKRDPAAFAVTTVQVRARIAGDGRVAGVPCGSAAGGLPDVVFTDLMDPRLPAWNTPFSRKGPTRRILNGIAWDPSGEPAIVALECLGNRARVIRIGLDGKETVISRDVPGQVPLDGQSDSLAVLPGGDVVVADTRNHRICRLTREGVLTTLAGNGGTGFDGDTDPEGRPRLAAQAALGWPAGLAVTAAGEVVFADWHHYRIRRFLPGGTIETLAGDGTQGLQLRNDLTRRHPATACSICFPNNLAAAPDGRILFTVGGSQTILVLNPDGTLGRARPVCAVALMTVAEDHAIVAWDGHQWLQRLAGEDEPVVLSETRLPLRAMAPAPGSGLLLLESHSGTVCWMDPPKVGRGLADRVKRAWEAVKAGDLEQAAAIRASLARWADTYPPSAEVVRDHLLRTASGSHAQSAARLPGLPDDLQAEPFEWLRGSYRGACIRARIALHELDQALERRAAGTVERLKAMAVSR